MKSQKQKAKEKEIDKLKKRNSSLPRILFTLFATILVVGLFIYNQFMNNKRIEVIRLTKNVVSGDVVDVNTCFKKHDMLYTTYLEEGVRRVTDENGNSSMKQTYVLWSDRHKYQDWYFNSYIQEDTVFTTTSASEEMQYKNPLLESMPIGNEEYVLDINSEGIDTHQLYPGTNLRMRVAFQVPISLEAECREAIANKREYDGKSEILKLLTEKGFVTTESGTKDVVDDSGFASTFETDSRTVTISEVIFDDIAAVDMLSTSGESIYEVYMSLLQMPLQERAPYLQTSFEDDLSGEFRARITPKSLVLNLTRDEANSLHEFEVMGYDTKWTIIKTATSSDMLKDFIEISDQIKLAGMM